MSPELDAAIDRLVARALAGEDTLDALVSRFVLGREPDPETDEALSPDRAWVFYEAAYRWRAQRSQQKRQLHHVRCVNTDPPTRDEVWQAVLELSAHHWSVVPFLTWPRLGAVLRLGARTTQWYVGAQGWRFDGGGRTRHVTEAPCYRCHRPRLVQLLNDEGACARCES
jgi:hypothetical protein